MISIVVVSYRSAALAARAIASFREEAERANAAPDVVVVVNSGDGDEARALSEVSDRVLLPAGNLGYAGGLNAGIAEARGELVLLANPDLVFLPGSVAALASAVSGAGFAVAGPALFWDDAATLLLPPAEEQRPAELARRVLATRRESAALLFRRDVRRSLRREALVRAGRTGEVGALSGALMAASRETLERAGPFDEGYRLYYEENDWQLRLRGAGGRLLVAGGSRVVHRYAQSTRKEPKAEAWFRESEQRYFESHFGEAGRRALARAATTMAGSAGAPPAARLRWLPGREVLLAISPFPGFRPFVLARPGAEETSFALPAEICLGHGGSDWFARAFDAHTLETMDEARLATAPPADEMPPPR